MRDLSTYPGWLDVVIGAEPTTGDNGQPAWQVTLKARVGPFARSKRLRIVRTKENFDEVTGIGYARFERAENDGREHSPWVMAVSVSSSTEARGGRASDLAGSDVAVDLSYGGGLWTSMLDPVLGSAIDSALMRLPAYVDA